MKKRLRGQQAPDDIRQQLAELLNQRGVARLQAELEMSRNALLGAASGCRILPGTLALLRERLPLLGRGEAGRAAR